MIGIKKIVRWLSASLVSGLAVVQFVSCGFGTSTSDSEEAREASHQRQATEEAKIQATRRFNDAKRNFEAIDARFQISKSQLEGDSQKHRGFEDALAKLLKEKKENEALVAKLDSTLANNKVSYPGV